MRIICFGDSITEGRSISPAPRPAEFVHRPSARWPALLQRQLAGGAEGSVQVLNKGIGGNNTFDALLRLHKDVLRYLPAIVILEFGFNDALFLKGWKSPPVTATEFGKNMSIMISEIRKRSPLPICVLLNHPTAFIHPQQNGLPLEENMLPYRQAILDLPRMRGVHRIDLLKLWHKFPTDGDLLSHDGLHLTEAGNRHYARLLDVFLKRILAP